MKALLLALATVGCAALAAPAHSQTLTSDQADYPPGTTATFTGAGFLPGEEVALAVHHESAVPDTGEDHDTWTVVADEQGGFVTTWHVCEDDCVGQTLRATADGLTSGLHAEVRFTDAQAWTLTVTPSSSAVSQTQTYTVLASNTSTGGANPMGCVMVTLPAGFTPIGSPGGVSASGGKAWTFSRSGQVVTGTAVTSGDRVNAGEAVTFQVTATAPASNAGSPFTWTGDARANTNCTGQSFGIPGGGQPTVCLLPTISCPAAISRSNDPGQCSAVVSFAATATGSPTPTITYSKNPGTVFPVGVTTVIATATNSCGSSSCSFTVTVLDAEKPSVTAPPAVVMGTGAGATSCTATVGNATLGTATPNDNCPGVTVSRSGVPAGNAFPVGTTVVTWTATDAAGNTKSATQNVTVLDDTPPVLALSGASDLTVECHASFTDPGASASDNCPGVGAVQVSGSVNPNVVGTYALGYSVVDAEGNTASRTRTVHVVDTTPPVITLAGSPNVTIECHSAFADPGASAADLCAGALPVTVAGAVDANAVGTYTLTYSANDPSGNTGSATRTVHVVDTTPPVLALLGAAEMTIECHGGFSDPGATASDLCAGNLAVNVSGTVDANSVGTYTLTYGATDPSDNAASISRTVHVIDTTPPVVTLAGASEMTIECHSVFGDPGASAADLCAGNLPVTVTGVVDANAVGRYTLTYSAVDPSGNSASATLTVHVVDTTPPVVTLAGSSESTIECHSSFADPGTSAADLCVGALPVTVGGNVDASTVGTYVLSYSATDPSGNTSSATRTVHVVDTTSPVLTLSGAPDMTIECHSGFADPGASAADLCAGNVSVNVSGGVDADAVGTYTLTYGANDPSGNGASATRTVRVVDTTAPILTLAGSSDVTVECHSVFTDPGASAVDLCAGNLPVTVAGAVDANMVGTYTLTYSASDPSGNSASATLTVHVVDTTPPVVSLAGVSEMTIECHSTFADAGASASDLCAGTLPVTVGGSVDVNTVGTYVLSYSATDPSGNIGSATRTVHVVDTTPPVVMLTGNADVTVECHAAYEDAGATASDACAGVLSATPSGAVDANAVGIYTLTFTATDPSGNAASVTRTVHVVDTTPPVVTLAAASDVTVECHSSFADPGASAADVCAGVLPVTVTGAVNAATVGTYTLTYSAVDPSGNPASATLTVHVVDTIAPVVTLGGASDVTVECHTTFGDPGASAADLCTGSLPVTVTGTVDPNAVGTYTLVYSATDLSGNQGSATRAVRVVDTAPPTLSVPGALTVGTGAGATICGAVVGNAALGTATATDACDVGPLVVRTGVPSGNVFPVGTTTLTYTATDASGNATTATQSVTVIDNTPPVIAPIAAMQTVVDANRCTAAASFAPVVSDNCSGVTFTCTPASGFAFPLGTTTVTCVATDAAGNTASRNFTVTVTNPAPTVTITAPATGTVVAIGTSVAFAGSFADNAGDAHTGQWTVDAVTVAGTVNESAKTVAGSYTFPSAGVYMIKLKVTDQCDGSATATQVGGLDAMVVVYDPSAGFVTGGGWINSPAGAYAANPSLTGRANFGFESKYKKGATTPTGETEFQYSVGSLNFHSTSYSWLVVAGAKAQYKGSGTINGSGDYAFLLSAVDGQLSGGGGVDRFRMKITNKVTGATIYDNQLGAPDTASASTGLGGGSIVIHSSESGGGGGSKLAGMQQAPNESGAPVTALSLAAAPNPFRGRTELTFVLPEASHVELSIYDLLGRRTRVLAAGEYAAGSSRIEWNGDRDGAAPGVYFVRLETRSLATGMVTTRRQRIVLN